MIGRGFIQADLQELPQTKRIGRSPRNPAFRTDSLEQPGISSARKYVPGVSDGRPLLSA